MPQSVIVVGGDPNLFERVRAMLSTDGRSVDAGDVLHCDGSLTPLKNIYPVVMTPSDWDRQDLRAG